MRGQIGEVGVVRNEALDRHAANHDHAWARPDIDAETRRFAMPWTAGEPLSPASVSASTVCSPAMWFGQHGYRHLVIDFSQIQKRELAALADDLSALDAQQWRSTTLCGEWDVEEVVAHLGAASRTSLPGWIRSMVAARFNPDVHNRRRLEEFRGATPQETLERFCAVGPISLPVRSSPAGLGEVIVHAEDIRKPLGLRHEPDAIGLLAVARFFATKNFAVNSKTLVEGLALRAVDADFREGAGPEVRGPLLSLVMVMAGRRAHLPDLDGDGALELSRRLNS